MPSRARLCDSMDCMQYTRPPCPSLPPSVCSNSSPLNQWCHPTISSSIAPFSSCCQSFPPLGSFQVSRLFTSGGQNIGASASASVLPTNIQGWFPLGSNHLISWQSKGLWRVFSSTSQKALILWHSAFFMVQVSHPYTSTGKIIALTTQTFVDKVMSLLFNMLSRFVIAFLPRSKHLLIAWLQPQSAVILEPEKIKYVTVSTFFLFICHEVMGPNALIFAWFLNSSVGKESVYYGRRHRRCRFDLWVGKISWRVKWQPTLVFLPEKSHGQRSLIGHSSKGHKELDMTELSFF